MVVQRNPAGLDTKLFSFPKGLTLTELEATTCLGLARLLTLYLTAVTCEEALHLQCLRKCKDCSAGCDRGGLWAACP